MAGVALRGLETAAGSGAVRASGPARAAAALSLFAAWIHFAYVADHWRDWWAYGVFFLATGALQALFVPAILRSRRTWVALVGVAGNLAIVGMYVVSRTAGVPVGPHAGVVERAAAVDLATTAAEILTIGLLLAIVGSTTRRWIANALLLLGLLLWLARLTGRLP